MERGHKRVRADSDTAAGGAKMDKTGWGRRQGEQHRRARTSRDAPDWPRAGGPPLRDRWTVGGRGLRMRRGRESKGEHGGRRRLGESWAGWESVAGQSGGQLQAVAAGERQCECARQPLHRASESGAHSAGRWPLSVAEPTRALTSPATPGPSSPSCPSNALVLSRQSVFAPAPSLLDSSSAHQWFPDKSVYSMPSAG